MNPKAEIKILREFIKIIDAPDRAEKKFLWLARAALMVCALLIFYCLSDSVQDADSNLLLAALTFVSGTAFGLGMWFLQAGTQTAVMVKHMHRDSITERIDALSESD